MRATAPRLQLRLRGDPCRLPRRHRGSPQGFTRVGKRLAGARRVRLISENAQTKSERVPGSFPGVRRIVQSHTRGSVDARKGHTEW
jgi:hypothetical protein